jgi:hypothetical protein
LGREPTMAIDFTLEGTTAFSEKRAPSFNGG